MATTPQNIETLRVVLEVDDQLSGLQGSLDTTLGSIEKRLLAFAANVTSSANKALAAISTAIASAESDIAVGTALIEGTLVAFGASLKAITDSSIAPFTKSLSQIGTFLSAVRRHTAGSIAPVTEDLKEFANSFGHVARSLATSDISIAAQNMARIGQFTKAVNAIKFEGFADKAYAVTSTVNDLSNALSVVKVTEDIVKAGQVFARLSSTLNSISRLDPGKIQPLSIAIGNLFSSMSGYASDETRRAVLALSRISSSLKVFTEFKPAVLTGISKGVSDLFDSFKTVGSEDAVRVTTALSRLVSGLNSLGKISAIKTAATLESLKTFMAGVAMIPTTGNVANVISTLNQLSTAMIGLRGGAGGVPPIANNVATSISRIPPVASRASASATTLSGSLRGLAMSAYSAHGSLAMLRYPVAGLFGLGLVAFAKFDDALTRVLAHMREFPELDTHAVTRSILEGGISDISSSSITGATELAKALDHLTSSGMNASAAVRGLAIAESFAVASGMQAADATQRLVDVQRAMGLSSENATTHFNNMTMLADRFAGMAPMVGSSTKQFMEAFGEKFTTVMRQTGMSLEEGIAIMGAYSIQGVRGSEASERAARMIRQVGIQAITSGEQWRRMHVNVRDSSGELRSVADIIIDLTNSLEGMTNEQATARLSLMGLQDRSLAAVMTLKGMGLTMKELQKQAGDTDGIMKRMADMLREDFMAQMKILWNNVSNVARAFGSFLAPAIAAVASGIESLTKAFRDLNPAYQQLIIISALAYVTFGALGPVWRAFGSVVSFVLAPLRMVASSLLMVASLTIGAIVGIAGLAVSFVKLGYAASFAAVSVVASVGRMFASIFTFFAGITSRLWMDVTAGFRVLAHFFANFSVLIVEGVFRAIEGIASLAGLFMQVGKGLAKAFVSGFSAMLAGITQLLISLAFGIVNLGLTLGTAFLAITAGLALVITLGGVIATAFKMVAVSIGAMWQGIKSGTTAFFENLNERAERAGDILVGMWKRAKEVTPAYFDSVMEYVSKLAGFFWNFSENVSSIWNFLIANWKTLTVDMGNAFATAVENMANNIKEFWKFLVEAGKIAFTLIGELLKIYGGTAFFVIKDLWKALLTDLGSAFEGFGNRFVQIWGQVMSTVVSASAAAFAMVAKGAVDAVARRLEEASLARRLEVATGGVTEAREALGGERLTLRSKEFWRGELARRTTVESGILAEIREFEEAPKRAIRNLFKKPFETPEGGSAFMSALLDIPGRFGTAGRRAMVGGGEPGDVGPLPAAMRQFQRLFADTFGRDSEAFKPLLEGFEATTKSFPVLNLLLPPDWAKKLPEKLGIFGPKPGEPGDVDAAASKQHPGFTFKQISLARTMLGGEAAETLDYQQLVVMRNMDRNLALLRAAAEEKKYRSDARDVITHMYGSEVAGEVLGE